MRANLRHVFANIIEAVPGLFSRILVTPSSSYALKDYHLSLAGSHASHILITVPTTIPYITAHHAHTSVGLPPVAVTATAVESAATQRQRAANQRPVGWGKKGLTGRDGQRDGRDGYLWATGW
jgi:hypothetical protein